MGKRKRPKYTTEYKQELVKLAQSGISDTAVRRRNAQVEMASGADPGDGLTKAGRQELTHLRRELRQVKTARRLG